MHCASSRETKSTGATSAYELKPLVSLHPSPTQRSPWMKPPPTPRGALTTTSARLAGLLGSALSWLGLGLGLGLGSGLGLGLGLGLVYSPLLCLLLVETWWQRRPRKRQ